MRCPNCSAINEPDAPIGTECGQRLIESVEPVSWLGITCGVLILIVFIPVGLCGVLCTTLGIEAIQTGGGAPEILLTGLTLTGLSALFIYLAIRFMKGR